MVDITDAIESEYITVDVVKRAQIKALVIIGEGSYEIANFNGEKSKRLTLPVEIMAKQKIWRPNRDTVINIAKVYGRDTRMWIGKRINLNILTIKGKELIIGMPDSIQNTIENDIF